MARELTFGGSERQMTEIALALDRSRFTPVVACFRSEGIRGDELRAAGVPVLELPVQSFKSPAAWSGAVRFARYIRREQVSIVHTWDYPATAFAIPIARAFTRAVTISSQRGHRDLTPRGYLRVVRWTDRVARGIVVNCDFLKRHLVEDYGVPAARIHLCYNGIDVDRFSRPAAGKPASLPDDALVVGTLSQLRPEKNLSVLIEAFAQVRGLLPQMKLVLVGSGAELANLLQCAARLGVGNDCVFQPAVADVSTWLHAMDIFVMPSRSEALSNALMEAMACGCACVASDVGGNGELIADGINGRLFQAESAEDLAAALRDLIGDPALRDRLRERAAADLRARFSIECAARRMEEVYDRLLTRVAQ